MKRSLSVSLLWGCVPVVLSMSWCIVSAVSAAGLDATGDGMSDVWQAVYGIGAADASLDPDADGEDNARESLIGTDPNDPNAHSRIEIDRDGQASVDIEWFGVAGKRYDMEVREGDGAWRGEAEPQVGLGDTLRRSGLSIDRSHSTFRVRHLPDTDLDGDGLGEWEEALLGTSPFSDDSDGDGRMDGLGVTLAGGVTNIGTGVLPGLVGLWTFDGHYADLGTAGADGTRRGEVHIQALGVRGGSATVRGAGDAISLGADSRLNTIAGPFTVAGWVYLESHANYSYIFSNDRDCCGTYRGFSLAAARSGNRPSFQIWNDSATALLGTEPLTLRTWHHLVGVYDGSQMLLYVDGELNASRSYAGGVGTPASFESRIGSMGNGASYNYSMDGKVDEVMVFERALTRSEVHALYALVGLDGPEEPTVEAAMNIRSEALLPNAGPAGHPLPLAAHWNKGHHPTRIGYDPTYMLDRIEEGDRILPGFAMPGPRGTSTPMSYFEPALRRAAELKLPITFIGTQWESILYNESYPFYALPPERNPNVIEADALGSTNKIRKQVSPFGPVEPWYEAGRLWGASDVLTQLQAFYPDPPMVIFLSNNEAAHLRWIVAEDSQRYLALHGAGRSGAYIREVFGNGWAERYAALLEGFHDGLSNETWRARARFMGYKAFGGHSMGRWSRWKDYAFVNTNYFDWAPFAWDGGSPSYYFKNPGTSSDYKVYSLQTESMNWPFMAEEAHGINPDYWIEMSVWDGGTANWNAYTNIGQAFTPARYGAAVTFGMWVLRARAVRQFRGWSLERAVYAPWFDAVVDAVNVVHDNPTLRKFWRYGELVPNPVREHPYQSSIPAPYDEVERWYMLESSRNPEPVSLQTALSVFGFALTLGEGLDQEWLIYAHAPTGALTDVDFLVPGYGEVHVDVPVEGAYYTFIADGDRDDMADAWERAFFGDLDEVGTDDFDGDGVINRDEYNQGSDPTVAGGGGAIFYVDSGIGRDELDGLSPTILDAVRGPKRTLSAAYATAGNGATIRMAAGTYRASLLDPGDKRIVLEPMGSVTIE